MIPPFEPDGNLPAGIHPATWAEVCLRYGITPHRSTLLNGLLSALKSLKKAGCRTAYLDGSFVTSKPIPGDFDACWEISGVDPHLLDPVLLNFDNRRAAQKAKYHGELFPAQAGAAPGSTFLEFFQQDSNTGLGKGIILLDLGANDYD